MNNYEKFLQLHHQMKPLIIANAWNVKSAQIIQNHGYDAIATSSGAIADSLGYPDGERIPFGELVYVIKRITANISIPLSVDMERGYTNDLSELNENIQKLIDLGVAGVNLEDAQGEDIFLKKLSSIKSYLTDTKQKLFINARTDVFPQKLDAPLETILKRAAVYKSAGADGLFVPGIQDTGMIKEITSTVKLPVNVVGLAKFSSVKALTDCGVSRISMAVLLYRATYNHLENNLKTIQSNQSFATLI